MKITHMCIVLLLVVSMNAGASAGHVFEAKHRKHSKKTLLNLNRGTYPNIHLLRGPTMNVAVHDDDCAAAKNSFRKNSADLECRPRETIIHLQVNDSSFLQPNAVLVNRCDGTCRVERCVANHTVKKKIYVLKYKNNVVTCSSEEVEEHKSCRCDCPQRATDCNPWEEYDHKFCRCKCRNTVCGPRQYLDEKSCQCKCNKVKSCTTGSYFNEETCRCIRNRVNKY